MSERTVVWHGWPWAPAPTGALRKARRANVADAGGAPRPPVTTRVVDDAGRPIQFGWFGELREFGRNVWLRALDAMLAGVVALVVPRRATATATAATTAGEGPVVLVLAVLPDLSHTFVYREVLAMLRQRPEWRVVVLQRNERAPVHAEARELLAHATFLRREGITRRALRVLGWLSTARGRALFARYRAEPGSRLGDLLGKLPLRDPRHPGNAFALADQLAPLRPRHVHAYSSTYAANVALGAAALLGVPASISSYVDFEFPYAHKMLAAKLAQATFFRVVTEYCRRQLLALPDAAGLDAERVAVVLLGLDLANWQQRAPLPGNGVLVSAARLVPKKGLRVVPAALATLRARGVRCRWRVIGDGPELAALQQACTQHGVADLVDFLGPRDNAAVKQELLAADLAVLPCIVAADGERDGIPIFLVEAMALGVPAVTTPVAGIPELVRDGDTGLLAAPGDSAALADVLQRALGDRQRARAIGERGRAAVHAALDVDVMAGQLIARIER